MIGETRNGAAPTMSSPPPVLGFARNDFAAHLEGRGPSSFPTELRGLGGRPIAHRGNEGARF